MYIHVCINLPVTLTTRCEFLIGIGIKSPAKCPISQTGNGYIYCRYSDAPFLNSSCTEKVLF